MVLTSARPVGRIIKQIDVEGHSANALFDSGAVYSYVLAPLAEGVPRRATTRPSRVVLGGQTIEIKEQCFIHGKIEGLDFDTDAVPVADLGTADGYKLDAIIGARTMEQFEIRLDPKSGSLDLEGLRRREFIEYSEAILSDFAARRTICLSRPHVVDTTISRL